MVNNGTMMTTGSVFGIRRPQPPVEIAPQSVEPTPVEEIAPQSVEKPTAKPAKQHKTRDDAS